MTTTIYGCRLARLKAMPKNTCCSTPSRLLSLAKRLKIGCNECLMLGYLLGIDTFKRLMNDHGVEFYLGRCPLDPGHKCGGVPGAYGLPSLDCCSNKTKPKWMMVGTYLKNHPLANLLVCADCYPNVLHREHRILKHWIVNKIPNDIPEHDLHRIYGIMTRFGGQYTK